MKKNDILAFPTPTHPDKMFIGHHGMTLLDYFAGQALIDNSSYKDNLTENAYKVRAEHCYKLADAMLKERLENNY